MLSAHAVVLVGGNGRELRLRKDESPEVFSLSDVIVRSGDVDDVKARLVLVH